MPATIAVEDTFYGAANLYCVSRASGSDDFHFYFETEGAFMEEVLRLIDLNINTTGIIGDKVVSQGESELMIETQGKYEEMLLRELEDNVITEAEFVEEVLTNLLMHIQETPGGSALVWCDVDTGVRNAQGKFIDVVLSILLHKNINTEGEFVDEVYVWLSGTSIETSGEFADEVTLSVTTIPGTWHKVNPDSQEWDKN